MVLLLIRFLARTSLINSVSDREEQLEEIMPRPNLKQLQGNLMSGRTESKKKQATISKFFQTGGSEKCKRKIRNVEDESGHPSTLKNELHEDKTRSKGDEDHNPEKRRKILQTDTHPVNLGSPSEGECSTGRLSSKTISKLSNFASDSSHNDKLNNTHGSSDIEKQNHTFASKRSTSSKGTINPKTKTKYTPLEEQFIAIKEQNKDAVLFVECGYKYRFFGEDAEIAAKELKIYCHVDHNFMTASIPVHRLFVHVNRLVAKGYKVGVVKQTETAALKTASDNRNAPFTRELSALYTKSTLIGEDVDPVRSMEEDCPDASATNSNTHLLCIFEERMKNNKKQKIAFVSVQPSTGDIVYDCFEDNEMRSELETRLSHIQPVELLLPEELSEKTEAILSQIVATSCTGDDRIRIERVPDSHFSEDEGKITDLNLQSNDNQSLADKDRDGQSTSSIIDVVKLPKPVICCMCALYTYLKDFNLDKVLKVTSNMKKFSIENNYMKLNAFTLRNLEIFKNATNGQEKGSLLWVINKTKTKFGSRLMRKWLSRPLLNKGDIEARSEAVKELLFSDNMLFPNMKQILPKLPDLEKGLCSILHQKCSPIEFLSVCKALEKMYKETTLKKANDSYQFQSKLLENIFKTIPHLLNGITDWIKALDFTAAKNNDKTQLFKDESRFPECLKIKKSIENVLEEIKKHRREIRLTLKQPALDYTTVLGTEFLVEVRNAHVKLVPSDWVKISSTKAVSRFHSPFIVSSYKRLNQLQEQLTTSSAEAWKSFLSDFEENYYNYREAVKLLATLDCLFSLAQTASGEGFCCPEITDDESVINIQDGRHIIVDILKDTEQFVPNDTNMKLEGEHLMVITGPNMGGKSSYIKQVALITILAQMGSFVPATTAKIGIVDGIYTRMGASDDLFAGRSTLMVELQETSDIMKQATCKSLVILDELGRGTSTHDGIAIAFAVMKYFLEKMKCLALFVTHYPSLTELEVLYPKQVKNYHMSFMIDTEKNGDDLDGLSFDVVTFLYQIIPGIASCSYGLNVAKLAEIPTEILNLAAIKSQGLEKEEAGRRNKLDHFYKLYHELQEEITESWETKSQVPEHKT